MKQILIAAAVIVFSALLVAQSVPENEFGLGLAGNSSCRSYFGVVRLEAPASTNSLHHMTDDQLRWWNEDGYKKAPGLCYVSNTVGNMPALKAGCKQCPVDWKASFYWIVMTRLPVAPKGPADTPQPSSSTQFRALSTRRSSPPPQGFTLSITAAVYAGDAPLVSPTLGDMHLFRVTKNTDSATSKPKPEDYMHVDRDALKEAAGLIMKTKKR